MWIERVIILPSIAVDLGETVHIYGPISAYM